MPGNPGDTDTRCRVTARPARVGGDPGVHPELQAGPLPPGNLCVWMTVRPEVSSRAFLAGTVPASAARLSSAGSESFRPGAEKSPFQRSQRPLKAHAWTSEIRSFE